MHTPPTALSAINTRSELNLHLGNNSGCGPGDYNTALGSSSRTHGSATSALGAAGNHRQLTDLSAGTQASDAVNVAQMSNSHRAMMTIEHDDIRSANTRIDHLGKLFSGQTAHRQQQMTQQHNQSNGGIASVAAMADIPYTNQQTFSTGLGVTNYRNANAVAIGAQYRLTPRTDIRLASAWDNRDGEVSGAGIAYGW